MLLDNEPDPPASPSESAPAKGPGVVLIVIALLVVAAIAVFRQGGGSIGAPTDNPTVVNGGEPPPSIFDVQPGAPIPPSARAWAVCANPNFQYWFEYPTAWKLSVPPKLTPPGAARMIVSPTQPEVAILVIPFGLYGSDTAAEVQKAEFSYLGDHTLVEGSERKVQVNGHEGVRRQYTCRVPTAAGFEPWSAEVVIVSSGKMGYGLFLRSAEGGIKASMATFDKIVASFHIEKLPLRAGGAAPPPSGAPASEPSGLPADGPSGAPALAPSGAPALAPSGAPALAPSGAPALAPSGAPALAPSGAPALAPSGAPAASLSPSR